MLVYIIMLLISILFAFCAEKIKNMEQNNKNKILYIVCCIMSFIPPFLVSAFRDYSIGTDTPTTYLEIYNKALQGIPIRDKGFMFIVKIATLIFNNYTGVLIITSFIINSLAFYSIYKESKNPLMSIFLYFTTNVYFISMNMIRQSISIGIFILAIPYIKKRNVYKFYFCMLVACLVHPTSVLYIPTFYLYKLKMNVKKAIIFFLGTLVFSNLILELVKYFIFNIPFFKQYFGGYFNSIYNSGELNIVSLTINILIVVFLLFICKNDKENKEDEDYNILLWNEVISMCLLMLSSKIPLMQRTAWLFSFPLYVYLPKMFDFIEKKNIRIFFKIAVNLGYLAYMIATIFVMKYHAVYPYLSIFQ